MKLKEKYAELAISKGINLQKGQTLIISIKAEHYEMARILVDKAYAAGAKRVIVKYSDDFITRSHLINQDLDTLVRIPQWFIDEYDDYLSEDLCRLSMVAPSPGLMSDVDQNKLSETQKEQSKALTRVMEYTMANRGQWTVMALPTMEWAKTVFPELDEKSAYNKLWESILYATRVNVDNDPIKEWDLHNKTLNKQNKALNEANFDRLHFKNSKGTDIVVGLVKNHIWAGGEEVSEKGHKFNPNMPTEESFTMPDRLRVDGIVYSSKPLNYQGNLIDDFYLVFEEGKVVDYHAEQGYEALTNLLNSDDGSRRIGEIALISYDSPISNLDILFYNTLFDENASCHMALGRAYPMNIKNGTSMTEEELKEQGANNSINHVDFMFGTSDLEVIGYNQDNRKIQVFKDGNFVL